MGTMLTRTKLFQYDAHGKIREWEIWAENDVICIEHGIMGGAKQTTYERVKLGLGGRSKDEQVSSRINSRINKQYDRGYKDSPEAAKLYKGTNSMGMFKPMLAKPIKQVTDIDYTNAFVQHKYDGHRCLITKVDGKTIAYSRQGKLITSIEHILDQLTLSEGETLDGELYCHGVSLQTIGSWIKREQQATKNLIYHAYDCISEEPFYKRFEKVQDALCGASLSIAAAVPTLPIKNYDELYEHFQSSRLLGYEGTILRWGNQNYEVGKRSKYLVKVKRQEDREYRVIDIEPSRDNWAILVCTTDEGKLFKVNAPGTYHEKEKIYENRLDYIGQRVTIEFANLTDDGIPFHPVAIRFRFDI